MKIFRALRLLLALLRTLTTSEGQVLAGAVWLVRSGRILPTKCRNCKQVRQRRLLL